MMKKVMNGKYFDILLIMMFIVSGMIAILLNFISSYSSLRIMTVTACFMMLTAMVYIAERVVYIAVHS